MEGLAQKSILKSANKVRYRHFMHSQSFFTDLQLLCSDQGRIAGEEYVEPIGVRSRIGEERRNELNPLCTVAGLFLKLSASGCTRVRVIRVNGTTRHFPEGLACRMTILPCQQYLLVRRNSDYIDPIRI